MLLYSWQGIVRIPLPVAVRNFSLVSHVILIEWQHIALAVVASAQVTCPTAVHGNRLSAGRFAHPEQDGRFVAIVLLFPRPLRERKGSMNLKGVSVRRFALLLTLVMMIFVALVPVPVMAAPAATTAAAPAMSVSYIVKPGDTLSQIARYYGTTVSAIMSANGLSSTVIFVGQHLYIPSGAGSSFCSQYHYVRHGDTLSGIARWFGVNYSALASANGISNPSLIFVGQRICIPSPWGNSGGGSSGGSCSQFYTVVSGDNLSRIAQRCGSTVNYLCQLNGLANPSLIRIGQVLRLW